jgi:hypothetical protein
VCEEAIACAGLQSHRRKKVYNITKYIYWDGCETWSLTSREERRLRVLMRIFDPKRDEVTGQWRLLHNEELHDLCPSLTIVRVIKSRRNRWTGHVARMGRGEVCTGFGG